MKYCPYCGTVLVDGAVSFCAECGKKLPVSVKKEEIQETSNQSDQQKGSNPKQKEQYEKKRRRRQNRNLLSEKKLKEKDVLKEKKIRQPEPRQRPEQQPEPPVVMDSTEQEDDYDGYYDDVLPADEGHFSEGIDRGLVKKIILLIGMVLLVVSACVLIMYLL